MITIEQAKQLTVGSVLYHTINRENDHTPQRWYVHDTPLYPGSKRLTTGSSQDFTIAIPVFTHLHPLTPEKNDRLLWDLATEDSFRFLCLTAEEALNHTL